MRKMPIFRLVSSVILSAFLCQSTAGAASDGYIAASSWPNGKAAQEAMMRAGDGLSVLQSLWEQARPDADRFLALVNQHAHPFLATLRTQPHAIQPQGDGTVQITLGDSVFTLGAPQTAPHSMQVQRFRDARRGDGLEEDSAARKGIETVWLVDDDRNFLSDLEGWVTELGYTVRAFTGPERLFQAIRDEGSEPPDLIISDIDMRPLNGIELVRQVRADPALRHIPIILQTGSRPAAEIQESWKDSLGVLDIIPAHRLGRDDMRDETLAYMFGLAGEVVSRAGDVEPMVPGPIVLDYNPSVVLLAAGFWHDLNNYARLGVASMEDLIEALPAWVGKDLEVYVARQRELAGELAKEAAAAESTSEPVDGWRHVTHARLVLWQARVVLYRAHIDRLRELRGRLPDVIGQTRVQTDAVIGGLDKGVSYLERVLGTATEVLTTHYQTKLEALDVNQTLEEAMGLIGLAEEHVVGRSEGVAQGGEARIIGRQAALQIDVERYLEERLPPVVGNKTALMQVWMNLFLNAMEAVSAQRRKQIVVSTELVGKGSVAEIRITDTGPGISEADQRKIFDPFFTTKKKGTGVGLAMVHGIVTEQLQGSIRVLSDEGKGATFVIRLPITGEDLPNSQGDGLSSPQTADLTRLTGLLAPLSDTATFAVTDRRLTEDPAILDRLLLLQDVSRKLYIGDRPPPLQLVVSASPDTTLSSEAAARIKALGIPIVVRTKDAIRFSAVQAAVSAQTGLSLNLILAHPKDPVSFDDPRSAASITRTLDQMTFDIVDLHTSGLSEDMGAVARYIGWGA